PLRHRLVCRTWWEVACHTVHPRAYGAAMDHRTGAPQAARMPATTEGTRSEAFGGVEWGLLAAISLIWGSSFLLMDLGLEALRPGVVTVLRLALGAAALACLPQARRPVERA